MCNLMVNMARSHALRGNGDGYDALRRLTGRRAWERGRVMTQKLHITYNKIFSKSS